jgi:hypothetical protein
VDKSSVVGEFVNGFAIGRLKGDGYVALRDLPFGTRPYVLHPSVRREIDAFSSVGLFTRCAVKLSLLFQALIKESGLPCVQPVRAGIDMFRKATLQAGGGNTSKYVQRLFYPVKESRFGFAGPRGK